MKKALSFILVLAMVLCMSVTAFAAEGDQSDSTTITAVVPDNTPSYTIHVPADFTIEYGNTGIQEIGSATVSNAQNIPAGYRIRCLVNIPTNTNLSDGNGHSIQTKFWTKFMDNEWEERNSALCTCYSQVSGNYFSDRLWGIQVPSWVDAVPGTYTTSITFYFSIEEAN